jgi:hypothetical protein
MRDVVPGMSSLATDNLIPLTLSEQLDAMLCGWLDRHAPGYDRDEDGAPEASSRSPTTRSPRSRPSAPAGA